jgi:integrase
VKNSLALLVRVMEQAVRHGIIERNPARVVGWQREYRRMEDELDDPRSLALPDWSALLTLAQALVENSADHYQGLGDVVIFSACTAARIGEASGVRAGDIDTESWTWTVRRQTTPSPGGLVDKGTKGKRARQVPLIEEVQELMAGRIRRPRPRCAPVRRPSWWSDHNRRSARCHRLGRCRDSPGLPTASASRLTHGGLTRMADAGVPVGVLRKIAGHGSLTRPSGTSIRMACPSLKQVRPSARICGLVVSPASEMGPP